jgi:predicted amidophosphoribosyltransferase
METETAGAGWRARAVGLGRGAAGTVLGIIYPPTCIGCGGATGEPHTLCARCWSEIQFIERPYCERLGTPFAVDLGMALLFAGRDRRSAGVWAGPRRGAL